jgi:hypothetical protein
MPPGRSPSGVRRVQQRGGKPSGCLDLLTRRLMDDLPGQVSDLRVNAASKAFPQKSRVTDGPCRPGESNSPLTVTRSCGVCTHFPFPFLHPGRVLTSAEMLTNQTEASQAVSEKTPMGRHCEVRALGANRLGAGNSRKLQLTISAITDDDIAERWMRGIVSTANKEQGYAVKPVQTEGLH